MIHDEDKPTSPTSPFDTRLSDGTTLSAASLPQIFAELERTASRTTARDEEAAMSDEGNTRAKGGG